MKMTSFRKRIAIVMIFFAMAPVLFFGIYAYNNLSTQRQDTYEQGFYLSFSNDMEKLSLWLEGRRLSMISDGRLHYLSKASASTGQREGRVYEIIEEGTVEFDKIEKEAGRIGKPDVLAQFNRYNTNKNIADARAVFVLYLRDTDLISGKTYYIKEEIFLKELINAIERSLNDQFVNYSIFLDHQVIYSNDVSEILDPYDPYFNKGNYSTIERDGKYYMGIFAGNDPLGIHIASFRDYTAAIAQIKTYQLNFFLKVFLVGVAGAFISLNLARRMNHPLAQVKSAVEDILSGQYDRRISTQEQDEFGQIYESFNHLAEIETSNYKKIVESGFIIGEKNKQLIELNQELELSYEQLREAMTQLDLSRSKQEALIHNIGELIWTMDEEGLVTFVNQAVSDKLGYSTQQFEGELIYNFIVELESGEEPQSLIEQMAYRDFENVGVYFARKDSDEKIYMLLNTKRVHDDPLSKSIQCFARTISDDWIIHHMTLRRNKEMEITGQISWVLANNILLDELLEEIIKKIEQLLHPDLCLIGLIEDGIASIERIGGSYGGQIGSVQLALNNDEFKAALNRETFIRAEELYQHFRVSNESVYQAIVDYVILPLVFDQKMVGFFAIASSKKLSDPDLKVLQIISNQSATAIDKAQLYKTLKEDYLNTIRVLATAVEAKDAYTEGHSSRVSKMAKLIAKKLSDDETFVEEIEISGILHDIGKIGIYDKILTKRGRLSDEEYDTIMQHPSIGFKIIQPINLSQTIIDGILLHHKRYDLNGYPEKMSMDELPLSAGIIGVADAIDAMTSTRSYSSARSLEYAIEEVRSHIGTQFHPQAAHAVIAIFESDREALMTIINED